MAPPLHIGEGNRALLVGSGRTGGLIMGKE